MKKWIVPEKRGENSALSEKYGALASAVMSSRGINSPEAAEEFMGGKFSDPRLIADIEKAADVIRDTMSSATKITVYGDCDTDGVTGTAMLYGYLNALGVDVDYYIPEHSEGFGMNIEALKSIINAGTALVITVDNGTNAVEEAKFLREHGVELVITDHHQQGEELPVCAACVNPNRRDDASPFKDLCGAAVVLKLLCVLEGDEYYILNTYSDLAAVATIGDVMPLRGENRFIVNKGLKLIKQGASGYPAEKNEEIRGNLGLRCLIKSSGIEPKDITASDIAFRVSPRINAAKRVASAKKALRLLLAENEPDARRFCSDIADFNRERREIEEKIVFDIGLMLRKDPSVLNQRVIFLASEGWHAGIIGIACAKIVEKYGRPAVIISVENGEGRGSCRSIEGFPIHKMLEYAKDLLTKQGGHPRAGGFSVPAENIEKLRQRFLKFAAEFYPVMPEAAIFADLKTNCAALSVSEVEKLSVLEPFGEGNPKPVFWLENCLVTSKRSLKDGKYTSFEIKSGGAWLGVVTFEIPFHKFAAEEGDFIDVLCTAEINEYNNKKRVQLRLLDYRPTGFREDRFFAARRVYEALSRGEGCDKRLFSRVVPQNREELKKIYDIFRKYTPNLDLEQTAVFCGEVNYCMLHVAADAFCEAGMAELHAGELRLIKTREKQDLFAEGALLSRVKREILGEEKS